MKITTDLIGKDILRIKPSNEDYKFTNEAIRITNVTGHHFYYKLSLFADTENAPISCALNEKYNDDNWVLFRPHP